MHLVAFVVGIITNNAMGMISFIDFGSFNNTLRDPAFWLTSLLTTATCILPVQAYVWLDTAYGEGFTQRLYRLDRKIEAEEVAGTAAASSGAGSVKVPLLSEEAGRSETESGEGSTSGSNPLRTGGLKGGAGEVQEGSTVKNPASKARMQSMKS